MAIETNFFEDEDFQDRMVALMCKDSKFLRDCASLLEGDDFKPVKGMRWGRPRWVVAERALDHYTKYHEPCGKLIRANVLAYAESIGMGARQIEEIREYLKLIRKLKPSGPSAITDMVLTYKTQHLKAQAIQELVDLQVAGQLTDEKWYDISRKAVSIVERMNRVSTDYFTGVSDRIERRRGDITQNRVPLFFIDPLDAKVKGIGPGQIGMSLAPTKRGKSLFLLWIAQAFVLQRLNVLFFTLEDSQAEVEDRLDSIISKVPLQRLHEKPKTVKSRFLNFKRLVHTQLRIIDGTEGGMSVARIEQILLRERESGFRADVVIIDYDDEIVPPKKQKERRFEFSDIYRDLRQFASRYNIILWTAAQTQRGTEHMKILSGDHLAEDFSKIRKVTMALSLGQGDWNKDSIYLWVAAHRHDKQHLGCTIMTDKNRMLIYDRERTRKMMDKETDSDLGS